MGIEPTCAAWKAAVLHPLKTIHFVTIISIPITQKNECYLLTLLAINLQ